MVRFPERTVPQVILREVCKLDFLPYDPGMFLSKYLRSAGGKRRLLSANGHQLRQCKR
jgi:hypothetical protein